MSDFRFIDYIVIGQIQREFIVDLAGKAHSNSIGGNALYTVGGILRWDNRVGIISKANKFTVEHLFPLLDRYHVDHQGVELVEETGGIEDRFFMGFDTIEDSIEKSPEAFYSSKGLPFPTGLLQYNQESIQKNKSHLALNKYFSSNFPQSYLDAHAVHICATNFDSQFQLLSLLGRSSIRISTLITDDSYMTPLNWDDFLKLVKDLSTVITSKKQIYSLFRGRSTDIWEMMEAICSMGCGSIVVVDGQNGQYLLDSEEKIKYQIPAYPSRVIDPSGMIDSFCGGFISGLRRHQDSLVALIHGNISSSLSGEGTGPFYCLDTLKQLVDSRVLNLKKMVKIV
jgi:hypothetical protein